LYFTPHSPALLLSIVAGLVEARYPDSLIKGEAVKCHVVGGGRSHGDEDAAISRQSSSTLLGSSAYDTYGAVLASISIVSAKVHQTLLTSSFQPRRSKL
jgi:hypothetical protein